MWLSNAPASNTPSSKTQRQGAIALLCVSLVYVSLIGCAPFGWSQTDRSGIQPFSVIDTLTIAAIKQTAVSTIAQTKIVQVKGTVGNHAPLLGKTAYELQDSTGRIWVLATHSIPNPGDQVVIKGKLLYQSILLNGREQGSVYLEQQ